MASSNKSHILGQTWLLLGFRIAQLVIAIIVLGLSAYGVYFWSYDGDSMTLATAVISIVICIYVIVATLAAPVIYNYWAILGLDIVAVILWIVSFPLLASEIASAISYYDDTTTYDCTYEYAGYCYYKSKRGLGVEKRATTTLKTYKNAMIAAAALGGLEFVLFTITLIILGVQLHRHRKAGGHCTPGSSTSNPTVHNEMKTGPQHTPQGVEAPEVYQPPVSH